MFYRKRIEALEKRVDDLEEKVHELKRTVQLYTKDVSFLTNKYGALKPTDFKSADATPQPKPKKCKVAKKDGKEKTSPTKQ